MADAERDRRPSISIWVITGLSIVLVVLAIQVLLGQRETHRADKTRDAAIACQQIYARQVELWANGSSTRDGLVATLETSRTVNGRLRRADKRWHRAVDGVFQLIVASRVNPDIPDETIDKVLDTYQKARKKLFDAYHAAQISQDLNPYPPMRLDCTR